MKRTKRHRVKTEASEPSSSHVRDKEEHDLAYYIHDRVELMHQVFSAIKPKDVKAFTPQCIRHLSLDNIKELCTEELLGISSKRLCAILDGAPPPSDTESSSPSPSPDHLETISLDSISSDEEILSQTSSRKKHKHRRRESKNKSKRKKNEASGDESGGEERSRASRAGLTVLELLELQARARAIRAQLQQEHAAKKSTETADSERSHPGSSDDEVMLKEEPPEVVEISSDEEKPSTEQLQKEMQKTSKDHEKVDETSHTVTKRINDLIITVPQTKPTRKIKLNRTKSTATSNSTEKTTTNVTDNVVVSIEASNIKTVGKTTPETLQKSEVLAAGKDNKAKEKLRKKKDKIGKKKKAQTVDKEGIDHDEIMLQLSDSEKLDLLEDFDRKNYDRVSSSSSEDSESSSEDSDAEKLSDTNTQVAKINNTAVTSDNVVMKNVDEQSEIESEIVTEETNISEINNDTKNVDDSSKGDAMTEVAESDVHSDVVVTEESPVNDETIITNEQKDINSEKADETEKTTVIENHQEVFETNTTEDKSPKQSECISVSKITSEDSPKSDKDVNCKSIEKSEHDNCLSTDQEIVKNISEVNTSTACQEKAKNMSDGELSDRDSSEVEATDLQSEVVCISDDDENSKTHKKKKHKKKERKNKKEKKSKKSKSDFREGCDENFFKENVKDIADFVPPSDDQKIPESIVIDDDHIYEILELSDDSSCYEVEGAVLSKEPTAEEIEALSAKIDEIKREDVVTEEEIREHERKEAENSKTNEEQNEEVNIELMSWKDRYISSNKVKKVLSTSNIFNALRKKNKDLKKKLEESKIKEALLEEEKSKHTESERIEEEKEAQRKIEGSVQFYNTLESSTKYVDPVPEPVNEEVSQKEAEGEEKNKGTITNEMKKDAKQLLKMYKRLLKYNDMDKKKQKDPNKKKKKKQKKRGKDDASSSVANADVTNGV